MSILTMENSSENEEYCKYCGKDVKRGHSIQCPLVHGIRVNPEGNLGFGFKADPNDMEWNLQHGRMMILFDKLREIGPRDAAGRIDFVTDDKKIVERLVYESAKFSLERVNEEIHALRSQKSNPLKRIFINRKINKLEKTKPAIRKFAEAGLPPEKVEELFSTIFFDESIGELFELTKNVKVDMKRLKEREKETQRPIFTDVKNPEENKGRYWALNASMSGEFAKAIDFCNRGLKINPEGAYLFYMRGRSEGDLGELKEGIEDLNRAIELFPNFAEAYVERGVIKSKLGYQKGAMEDYKKAKEVDLSVILPE